MPAIHFTSMYRVTALPISHFIPRAKYFYLLLCTVPFTKKQFRSWEVCRLDDPWSFAASNSLMHFINRCTWKSSQYYIIISMMTSFIISMMTRMSQKLVFHQSECISAIKRILSTTAMYVSSSSFMHLHIPCYCDACLNSSALRVEVKTLLNAILCSGGSPLGAANHFFCGTPQVYNVWKTLPLAFNFLKFYSK